VHIYLTQPEMMEVQTGNIIKMLWDNDVRVYTSISNFEDCSMTHYLLLPTTEVKNNRFNFPEPVNAKLVSENAFEVVLTPLLCMDLDGNRVGYGKGFYDRFFAKCGPEVIKIGLSLFEPVEKIDDVNEFDFPLDFAFTPDDFYAF
jgi:5-formyltetrahydrofolate cyclo-ligase